MKKNVNRKQAFVEAFRKATQEHTHAYDRYDGEHVEYAYPIPFGKYTIDEKYSRNEICIRCRKCWTDDLIAVAKKVAPRFRAGVSSYLGMSGFGTAYNFFTIRLP
jgi:hypothetical protein